MVATLEPGLACMVRATDDGGTKRMHAGNLVLEGAAGGTSVNLALVLPFFAGAILTIYNNKVLPCCHFDRCNNKLFISHRNVLRSDNPQKGVHFITFHHTEKESIESVM